jgi:diguanylate cyclase (GGDEF)-like protein
MTYHSQRLTQGPTVAFEQQSIFTDLPDSPHARQLSAGFPWLTFAKDLEGEFRRLHLSEHVRHIRVNLFIAAVLLLAFSAMDVIVIGAPYARIVNWIHFGVMVPLILLVIWAGLSTRRDRYYAPVTMVAAAIGGLCVVAILALASRAGVDTLFPGLLLITIFLYFFAGLLFYQSLTANLIIFFSYLATAAALEFPVKEFAYNNIVLLLTNLVGAAVAFAHERTSRTRFLESGVLQEMVARDGLTGIQNRRMFDQHIQRVWQQALRERHRIAVLLVDIDCFKDYNDFYGHQAGDECLKAVALSLNQGARRPLDFVARYGGEEFAVILYQANREYVAEVLTRIQRSIAELNIPHEASRIAQRLTVSVGAAFAMPGPDRTQEGLIQMADEALYAAKEQGRNRVVVMETEYQSLKTGRFQRRSAVRVN